MELFYNPERMSETEIKETFVAHKWLVDEIMASLAQQPQGAGIQHTIIVAPRGMGKTTVLLMLRFAVLNNSEVAQHWQPVLFPEESYEVYDLADLWLAVLGHISNETADAKLNDDISTLQAAHPTTSHLEEAALARIKDWREEKNKQLLLLVDNFDIILQQIGNERDHARLRDVLMNDGTMMLVGGATTFFKEARAYDQPLYNLFRIYNLNALTSEQMNDLLRRRARLDGIEDFDEILRANATRLRVLEYFTGGNPRLVLMLYRVITHSQISEVRRGLEKLLDEVTPYYKAKIESLPPQQRKILDHIARITARTREGLTPTEIASSTRLAVNHVSAQLKRLSDVGYVRAANIRGRSSYYTLSEPLYAIWHQMRFGRDVRKRMNWLVTFLKSWYDTDQVNTECQRLQNMFQDYLREGHVDHARDVLEYRRYLVEVLDRSADRAGTVETIVLSYLDLKDFDTLTREVLPEIDVAQLTENTKAKLVSEGLISPDRIRKAKDDQSVSARRRPKSKALPPVAQTAFEEQPFDEALKNFNEEIERNPTSLSAHVGLAVLLVTNGRVNESIAAFRKAEAAFPTDSPPAIMLSGLRAIMENDFKQTIETLNKLAPKQAGAAWGVAGSMLVLMSKHEQALTSLDRVVEFDPQNFKAWYLRGRTLTSLTRYEEALESFDRALQVNPDSYDALYERGCTLAKLERHTEAILTFDRALEVSPHKSEGWVQRGISLVQAEKSEEALASFEKVCELEPESYRAHLLKSGALAKLHRLGEAVAITDKILNQYPKSADALLLRGLLLVASGEREQAMESFREAFSVTSGEHRDAVDSSIGWSIKLMLSLADGNIEEAKVDWQRLKECASREGGEARWLEIAAQALTQVSLLGNWPFVRTLIGTSNLEEPLFPLARALDYLTTGDEKLVEKLSPEVRVIVDQVINTLKNSSSRNRRQKKHSKKKPTAQVSKSKNKDLARPN